MISLNEKEMREVVSLEELMTAIERAFAIYKSGDFHMADRYIAKRDKNVMMYMPCFADGYIGTKMLAEFPDNPKIGLPYLDGVMILNNAQTGTPEAIMNGQVLTALRTGAVGGVAVTHFAAEDCTKVGLIGCGVQGLHQLLYACTARAIKEIYLFDAFNKNLEGFITKLTTMMGREDISITVCDNTTELLAKSETIIMATQATEPVLPNDAKLLEGKCFIAIGSWRPTMREMPDAIWDVVENVYTELPFACEESGDLAQPLESGILTEDRVKYMSDFLADKKDGKAHKLGNTRYYKSVGMGLFDVVTAKVIYEKALEKGLGTKI